MANSVIKKGTLHFTIESRILRELGERLVKQPEVAVLELVKNAYDADATECIIDYNPSKIIVRDNGSGMTFDTFSNAWMRIGTSSKESLTLSPLFKRIITGEKGIGRFAVRFLGRSLDLETIAYDKKTKQKTKLTAQFDWPQFDMNEDLGLVHIPYKLEKADDDKKTGTTLTIFNTRKEAQKLDFSIVRTGSVGILSPLRSLFRANHKYQGIDEGFSLIVKQEGRTEEDVGNVILENYVLKATVQLSGNKLKISVFKKGKDKPYLELNDTYNNDIKKLSADIRFYPRREGTFTGLGIDGRVAQGWMRANSGIAVFDRDFRVLPYGLQNDDWLKLAADNARNLRVPSSSIAKKHFPMRPEVVGNPALNWMLKLPQPFQLIGLVQVEGTKVQDGNRGLIAAANREGFINNEAYKELEDIIRGAAEVLAYCDREIQKEDEKRQQRQLLESIREETKTAIKEIKQNPRITAEDKTRLVKVIAETQRLSEIQEETGKKREQQLEIMSLLGVVAGFMTHEFGAALQELESAHNDLRSLAKQNSKFKPYLEKFTSNINSLKDFVTYSQGYIAGSKNIPDAVYPAKPRLAQVKRVFGKYAEERGISVKIDVDGDVAVPLVPPALYNGVALNLYTNALKAVAAKAGSEKGEIVFNAWNDERWHYLQVSDTGVGIPTSLSKRVFDPLFTTTQSRNDPLGSGMGLGLSLVKRGVEAYSGKVELIEPPEGFSTAIRIKLPLEQK